MSDDQRYPKLTPEQWDRILDDLWGYEEAKARQERISQFLSKCDHRRQVRQLAKEMVESIEKRPKVH